MASVCIEILKNDRVEYLKWLDIDDYEAMKEEIDELMLAYDGDSWEVGDKEGFAGWKTSRLLDLQEFIDQGRAIESCDYDYELIELLIEDRDCTPIDAIEVIQEGYIGEEDTLYNWAYDYIKEIHNIDHHLLHYVDCERWALEAEMSGDIQIFTGRKKVYVLTGGV